MSCSVSRNVIISSLWNFPKFVEVCKYDARILFFFLNLSYIVVQYTTLSPVLAFHILRYRFLE